MIPEWIGSVLFLAAVGLTGYKVSEDFGQRGELGYLFLILMIAVYAGAIGAAWS